MLNQEIKLYENRTDVTLTTYITAEKGELNVIGPRPAIIICPGGGYLSCSDTEAEPVALSFCAMGYQAFVLRYSTYLEGQKGLPDLWQEHPAKQHCQHPAPVREMGKAMLLIREHAEEWCVDVEKIAVCGFSAGAHNAAMYATNWHTALLSEHFQREAEVFRPAAAILGYTLSDYIFMKELAKDPFHTAFFNLSNTALLGEATPGDDALLEVSPCRQVSEYTPPMFLWATAEDNMVPVQHTIRMAHALADQKIPFEMHVFEEGEHGLSLASQATAVAKTQIKQDAAKWIGLAESWLVKRFELSMPEKLVFDK